MKRYEVKVCSFRTTPANEHGNVCERMGEWINKGYDVVSHVTSPLHYSQDGCSYSVTTILHTITFKIKIPEIKINVK